MSQVCNKQQPQLPGEGALRDLYDSVDTPVATGSAHLMRAGSELHLVHRDLELGDRRQAGVRVACAAAAVRSALADYESSREVARELGFHAVHDARLRAAGREGVQVLDVLREAGSQGLVALDEESLAAIAAQYAEGGDESAFGGFIETLRTFSAELDTFARTADGEGPVEWQQFAWKSITEFDRIRIRGQAIAIINIFGMTNVSTAVG